MKKILSYWPYAIALIPQFICASYTWVVLMTIFAGIVSPYFIPKKNVFVKIFLIELVVFSIVFLVFQDRVFYLKDFLKYLELPAIGLPFLFSVFNALNIAILFFTGYKLSSDWLPA